MKQLLQITIHILDILLLVLPVTGLVITLVIETIGCQRKEKAHGK